MQRTADALLRHFSPSYEYPRANLLSSADLNQMQHLKTSSVQRYTTVAKFISEKIEMVKKERQAIIQFVAQKEAGLPALGKVRPFCRTRITSAKGERGSSL